jgi:hypothetical protein
MILLRSQLDAKTIFPWLKTSCENNVTELIRQKCFKRMSKVGVQL